MIPRFLSLCLLTLTLGGLGALPVRADDPTVTLTIRNHVFEPMSVEVPAGQKIRLLVKNLDATPEEFESPDLRREKVIPAGKEVVINIGPLNPGAYKFFGEYNPKSAVGVLIVK